MYSRRNFIKKTALGSAGVALSGSVMGMSAQSYRRIIGSNERLNVAIAGLGRRLSGFYEPIAMKDSNVRLMYLCDVMESQRINALRNFSKQIDYRPELENDIRKVIDDRKVDAIINATPDHWHTPGSIMALKGGKHVYVEKPSSHNMKENELLVEAAQKYGKVVQMGNQQRSSDHTIEIINEIHKGVIGVPYKAVAFYNNSRGEVPVQRKAPVPQGLDWELWQGPALRRDYTEETWDYNWHWYGWNYGTAEAGNNGTHELDIARWALQVRFPNYAQVEAAKRHFIDDGWQMYDTMEATFKFPGNKIIQWDGKSRNGYSTYGDGRGTVIYGSEGTVFIDRGKHILYDRNGKLIKEFRSVTNEAGNTLGGGGDMTTMHVRNFFDAIRGKTELNAPVNDANVSMAMVHYANIASRIGKGFKIDEVNGRMYDRDAMKLWGREYAPGWEPKL
ncbi:Gfo/Idh/MocA family oxidoreductase [Zunongwangia sp. F260]|uniref:Gfo/Idh/MocA family oxidoreductase n=1 Tax=Autumnicola lenta TaxID=3075593 RepID=A0ABU3CPY9_9FLAO|nr:Gfo/Idh/MocA family oxidoreductase [Zunongwangia sp. F260]MDT0647995.1 Gfo/Idh/MocA family oxidoreductase [Zunongwangia sp. F260]